MDPTRITATQCLDSAVENALQIQARLNAVDSHAGSNHDKLCLVDALTKVECLLVDLQHLQRLHMEIADTAQLCINTFSS